MGWSFVFLECIVVVTCWISSSLHFLRLEKPKKLKNMYKMLLLFSVGKKKNGTNWDRTFYTKKFATILNGNICSMAVGVSVPLPETLSPTRWGALPILCTRLLAYVSCELTNFHPSHFQYPTFKDLSSMTKFLLKPSGLLKVQEISELLYPIYEGILKVNILFEDNIVTVVVSAWARSIFFIRDHPDAFVYKTKNLQKFVYSGR